MQMAGYFFGTNQNMSENCHDIDQVSNFVDFPVVVFNLNKIYKGSDMILYSRSYF